VNEQGATNDKADASDPTEATKQNDQTDVRDQTGVDDQRKRISGWAWLGGLIVGLLVVYYLILAYMTGYDAGKRHGEKVVSTAQRGLSTPAASIPVAAGPGKQLFAATCGHCHTLKAASTTGEVGPNLDQLKPGMARVLAAIKNGGTGQGIMPTNLYTGQQAQQVAEFVSQVAGH
jgi:cytochrome c6